MLLLIPGEIIVNSISGIGSYLRFETVLLLLTPHVPIL